MDDVVEHLFGDVSRFACLVDEHGDNFMFGNIRVSYNDVTDIHSFFLEDCVVSTTE